MIAAPHLSEAPRVATIDGHQSVLDNWERELKRWGHFEVRKLGTDKGLFSQYIDEVSSVVNLRFKPPYEPQDSMLTSFSRQGRSEILLLGHQRISKVVDELLQSKRSYTGLIVDEVTSALFVA